MVNVFAWWKILNILTINYEYMNIIIVERRKVCELFDFYITKTK